MKKKKTGRILGRKKAQRKALLYGLAGQLFLKERIKTTESKAKEVRPLAEKLISRAGQNNLSARRSLLRFLPAVIVKKLLSQLGPKYKIRPGGYTRIIKLPPRQSDGAKMALIELVK